MQKAMKAAVLTGPARIEVKDVALPVMKAGILMIRV